MPGIDSFFPSEWSSKRMKKMAKTMKGKAVLRRRQTGGAS